MNKMRLIAALSILGPATCLATASSTGGIKIGDASSPYWFTLGGVLKLDQRLFFAGKASDLHSGASIRDAGLDFNGGLGKDLSYTLGLSFDAKDSKVAVEDAFLTHHGLYDKFTVSVGQVNPGFCLENTSSSKWISTLERSMPSVAFAPCPGLGLSFNKWNRNYAVVASITQPKHSEPVSNANGVEIKRSDRWQVSARATFAPIRDGVRLAQLGISGHVRDDHNAGIRFKTGPEAKSRHATDTLLDTNNNSGKFILAKRHSTWGFEALGQQGPLSGEVEYLLAKVKRSNGDGNGNLGFHGYRAILRYVLTGETREFNEKTGSFGKVNPASDKGAWEVAARYSHLNLNDKDILGGSGHITSFATKWYVNTNISVTAEYLMARIRKKITLNKRSINSLGARLQIVF